MATSLERRQNRLYGARIAVAAGIIVFLIGLYFIFSISGGTDKKNAECTEQVPGVVTAVEKSGSKYLTTIEYTPGYEPISVTLDSKKEYPVGTEIPVNYEPMSFKHIYVDGISPTGSSDKGLGVTFVLAGAVLAAAGALLERKRKK